jgi:hypothetical protein
MARGARTAYVEGMQWKKDGAGLLCRVPPEAIFTIKVQPKGDGRWTWEVYPAGGARTIASGNAMSVGAAKATSENFVKRSGKL